jgi:two-component system alkaline phosphatase synthesis response regulator PhoP
MSNTAKKLSIILIVEDDEPILYSLKKKFELIKGIKVISAGDGVVGLEKAVKERPDLILLDIVLPRMDGMEMLRKLREDKWGKTVKVIVLSNLSSTDTEQEAKELGVKDYIIKADWDLDDVVVKVVKNLKK